MRFDLAATFKKTTTWYRQAWFTTVQVAPRGNKSPELSWTAAPQNTKSFAVLTLDTTAISWHWGMYDVSPCGDSLPQNAGTKKSKYGIEVLNDWPIYFR